MASAAQSRWIWRTTLALVFLLSAALVLTRAQTFKVLHTFHKGKRPQGPSGQLVLDAEGNLYGVAGGGTGTCFPNSPCGTVFKMTKTGKLVWVYNFKAPGSDGNEPTGGLLRDANGNLFGVTAYGGVNTKACSDNFQRICGVVFKLDPTGKKETVLHRFTNNPDGLIPRGPLIKDSAGNLYGITYSGGIDFGVVFKLSPSHKETILYSFQNNDTGEFGANSLKRGKEGALYGTTGYGGDGYGTVFKLAAAGDHWNETVLTSALEGAASSLIWDRDGNLYGESGDNIYSGFVYKLRYDGSGYTVLYSFCLKSGCADGSVPAGGLVRDTAGNLYGVTIEGGQNGSNCNRVGCGVVFKLDTAGNETVLHAFTGGTDGQWPYGGLVRDDAGNLYGTAGEGGDPNCHITQQIQGCGVVFKITP